jgi:hypothetical protein
LSAWKIAGAVILAIILLLIFAFAAEQSGALQDAARRYIR